MNKDMITASNNPISPDDFKLGKDSLIQVLPIITTKGKRLLFFIANNRNNINSNTNATLFETDPCTPDAALSRVKLEDILPDDSYSGGICFSDPYLFLYGSNGKVLCSDSKDPYVFSKVDSEVDGGVNFKVGTDKVIYGTTVRGGLSVPTILFWTLSSVVRATNVTNDTGRFKVDFKIDVISNSSSIMSSRSVVEYDGLFYWMGTDRFYVYNGTVVTLPNNLNVNYILDNIDMNKRQLVYGVPNRKYEEIWWFYPEKANAGNLNIGCTRGAIYNIQEQSWYDTAISRDSGVFLSSDGSMYTFGKSLGNLENVNSYLFKHEVETDEIIYGVDNAAVQQPILSSFTTPIFSWASFSPLKSNDGIDRLVQLKRIEPDMKMTDPTKELILRINTKAYAQSDVISSEQITFTGQIEKIDYYIQGRQMSFTVSSTNFFEMGHWFMLLNVGDGRP